MNIDEIKLLVVDDEETLRTGLRTYLEQEGYRVDDADNFLTSTVATKCSVPRVCDVLAQDVACVWQAEPCSVDLPQFFAQHLPAGVVHGSTVTATQPNKPDHLRQSEVISAHIGQTKSIC